MSLKERAEILHRVGELIEERAPEIAKVETRDNGSLLRSMTNSVIPRAGYNFRFFADHLDKLDELEDFETRGHTESRELGSRPASLWSSRRGTRR